MRLRGVLAKPRSLQSSKFARMCAKSYRNPVNAQLVALTLRLALCDFA